MNIVLFDMDGTLTPPRKKITKSVIKQLKSLSEVSEIGIVTGSGIDYLLQQCEDLWSGKGCVNPEKITLMPCNGTQVFKWKDGNFIKTFSANMREELGDEKFDNLMSFLIRHQFLYTQLSSGLPLTGHHISYRESLVNWCPIGRNANDEQRKKFSIHDKEYGVRKTLKKSIEKFSNESGLEDIVFTLGGSTSIDVYPKGWDKTFSLSHFDKHVCWFVGDKCTDDGNDRTIYEKLLKSGKGFKTIDPSNTVEIIKNIKKKIAQTAEGK
tara:strand:- start:3750 stop:4550 length:801 start_codon:yes stop_codon:yes gene_type:complete